jgi:glycosyltransferase involved in cell wall biosynthesis
MRSGDNFINLMISVLLPAYNAEKYIREAMDSILTQSLSKL